jgi:ATP-dependent Lon protease
LRFLDLNLTPQNKRDEVDKVGLSNRHGDPFPALLEVFDPERAITFKGRPLTYRKFFSS